MNQNDNPFTVLRTTDVYRNPWIHVREDAVIRPGGKEGIFGVVTMKPGVTVVPITRDGEVFLVREYKYAVEKYTLECMSGGIDDGESVLEAARRELREEIGAHSSEWLDMGRLDPFTGIILSPNHIFLAQNVEVTHSETGNDEGEVTTAVSVPFDTAFDMAMRGEITHAASVAGLLKAHFILKK